MAREVKDWDKELKQFEIDSYEHIIKIECQVETCTAYAIFYSPLNYKLNFICAYHYYLMKSAEKKDD